MRCPKCETPLDDGWRCAKGHSLPFRDGIPSVLGDELRSRLEPFLDAFSTYREQRGERITDPAVYAGLPQSGIAIDRSLWKPRCFDLALVKRSIRGRERLRVLDIGAWNGWLSNTLVVDGHIVTALDYFTDPFDGIGAVRHYRNTFQAVQFDLERLDLINEHFDLVIGNRCAAYFEDLGRSIAQMKALLAPNGTLLLTGLNIHRSTKAIEAHFAAARDRFHAQHGMPYFFKPVRGFLSSSDVRSFTAHGLSIHSYPELRWKNMLRFLRPSKPGYFYAVYNIGSNATPPPPIT